MLAKRYKNRKIWATIFVSGHLVNSARWKNVKRFDRILLAVFGVWFCFFNFVQSLYLMLLNCKTFIPVLFHVVGALKSLKCRRRRPLSRRGVSHCQEHFFFFFFPSFKPSYTSILFIQD